MNDSILLKKLDPAEINDTPFALLWHVDIPEEKIDAEGFTDTNTSTGWQDSDADDKD